MHGRILDMTPQAAARLAGLLYLAIIAGGLFAEALVRGQLLVPGDAAATAAGLLDHASLYRVGFAVHLAYLLCAVAVSVILYELLRRVSPGLALLALAFNLVAIAVEAASLLQVHAALRQLLDPGLAGMEPAQLQAMAYAHARMFAGGFGMSLAFFGAFCLAAGVLIVRSRFLPRLLGVLMLLAGGCYLLNSFAGFLLPALAALLFPWILLPCLIAELSLASWLVVKGVDLARFETWSGDIAGT
jgi:hypothetical protein